MQKTLNLPHVRLAERVSKFKPTCSFIIMPKTTSIDKMVFSEVGDMGLIFQMTKFQPKRRPITHYVVQYVHTAQIFLTANPLCIAGMFWTLRSLIQLLNSS